MLPWKMTDTWMTKALATTSIHFIIFCLFALTQLAKLGVAHLLVQKTANCARSKEMHYNNSGQNRIRPLLFDKEIQCNNYAKA